MASFTDSLQLWTVAGLITSDRGPWGSGRELSYNIAMTLSSPGIFLQDSTYSYYFCEEPYKDAKINVIARFHTV